MSVKTGLFIPADDLPPHDDQSWSVVGFDNITALDVFQRIVNGYVERVVLPFHDVEMLVNEEGGFIRGLQPNRLATFLLFEMAEIGDEYGIIHGDVFITGPTGDDGYSTSLTKEAFAGLDKILKVLDIQPLTNE